MTEGERLAVLEFQSKEHDKVIADMNAKLDELLALRQKGMGAFWLATSLAGIVMYVLFSGVLSVFKG